MSEIKVIVNSVHFDADDKLVTFVRNKIRKLTNVYENIIEAEVFLKIQNGSNAQNKLVEIRLAIPGNDLFAKKSGKTFEESTDACVEALRRQVKKRKEKVWGI